MRNVPLLHAAVLLLSVAPVALPAQTLVREASRDSAAGVPKGMMPPAGKCRVWVDGVPATQQPAPTDCATALRQKPANAKVVYAAAAEPRVNTLRPAAASARPSAVRPTPTAVRPTATAVREASAPPPPSPPPAQPRKKPERP